LPGQRIGDECDVKDGQDDDEPPPDLPGQRQRLRQVDPRRYESEEPEADE